jgi:hypothetical protein
MVVPSSCLRKSLRSLAGCMAAAFSCMYAATARDLAFPDPSYGWAGISGDGRLAAATRDSDDIDLLSTALPHYLGGRRRDRPNVARDSSQPNATLVVTNCDDSGAGSLRDTIAAAVSGDTIDLTQLTCSTITLTSSYLTILQDDLTITGPGATALSIDGGGVLPLISHYGSGTLSIDGLTLTNGYYYYHGTVHYSGGGCMVSAGNVLIENSIVSNCTLKAYKAHAGAILTYGNLTVLNSVITHSQAVSPHFAAGGVGLVYGDLTLQYSTISDNAASSTEVHSLVGAFHVIGNVLIQNSTISGNQADYLATFLFRPYHTSPTALIINSTISDNHATVGAAGVYTAVPLGIYNSTIAFNTGVGVGGIYAYNAPLTLQSTIIADNDVIDLFLEGTATVSGANNLINTAPTVPPDTIRACPQLGPLTNNGGVTLTHIPRSTSPAVDAGNDNMALVNDQRGTGFPRIFGANADIGAVEWQGGPDEEIFNSGFEATCDR